MEHIFSLDIFVGQLLSLLFVSFCNSNACKTKYQLTNDHVCVNTYTVFVKKRMDTDATGHHWV